MNIGQIGVLSLKLKQLNIFLKTEQQNVQLQSTVGGLKTVLVERFRGTLLDPIK